MDEKTTKYVYNEIIVKDTNNTAYKLFRLNRKVSKQSSAIMLATTLFAAAAYVAYTKFEKLNNEMDILKRKMEELEDTKGE